MYVSLLDGMYMYMDTRLYMYIDARLHKTYDIHASLKITFVQVHKYVICSIKQYTCTFHGEPFTELKLTAAVDSEVSERSSRSADITSDTDSGLSLTPGPSVEFCLNSNVSSRADCQNIDEHWCHNEKLNKIIFYYHLVFKVIKINQFINNTVFDQIC